VPKKIKLSGKNEAGLRNWFVIFSAGLFLIILVAGSIAFMFSMRTIIRGNKGTELTKMLEVQKIMLESSVNSDISIVLKLADSLIIERYFADPGGLGLEGVTSKEISSFIAEIAIEELSSYSQFFSKGYNIFWISDVDRIFHMNENEPYWLDADSPDNYWYNMTLYDTEVYNFNINYNPDIQVINLWINAPVFDHDRKPLGMVGTGIDLSTFINTVYQNVGENVELYFFNGLSEITGAKNIDLVTNKVDIMSTLSDKGVDIFAEVNRLKAGETQTFDTPNGKLAIGTVPLLGWYMVAFMADSISDYNTAMTVLFLVVLVLMLLIFIIFNWAIARYLNSLRETMESLKSANRAKSSFLATMSHEMRTPMNAIIGMTAIGKKADNMERKDYSLRKIEDAAVHLLSVINDVLDISKIEAEKLELSLVEFNLERMLQKIVNIINFRMDEKHQKLTINIDSKIPHFIIGDDHRLSQVILNLLSNAVKFSLEGGEIGLDVTLASKKDRICELRIEVSDNGIGIQPGLQAKLFRSFEQADSGISREFGGTGLGLSISKHIVELMGGTIWVESEPGKGSRFIFTIEAECGKKDVDSILDSDTKQEIDAAGRFTGKKLLIAEDVEINREILISLLEGTGISFDCAQNGMEAVEMVSAAPTQYDAILMDVQMPKMDGLEATRRIRAIPEQHLKTLPIIAMTAHVFKSDIDECLAAGMTDHIGKPLDFEDVFKKLQKYLFRNKY
jgi:signal transduction histidine kinase/ActR/RegA family two-component response regulator